MIYGAELFHQYLQAQISYTINNETSSPYPCNVRLIFTHNYAVTYSKNFILDMHACE